METEMETGTESQTESHTESQTESQTESHTESGNGIDTDPGIESESETGPHSPAAADGLGPSATPGRRSTGLAFLFVGLLGAALGALGHSLVMRAAEPADGAAAAHATSPAAERLWTCPMHPTIVQNHPGECPICGMRLVPLAQGKPEGEHAAHQEVSGMATVTIDPAHQQLIGMRTVPVEMGELGATWRTVGRVAIDETRVRHVNIKVSGFVERVFVDFIGKSVARGQPLFTIYSPDLLAAQEEYILARRTRSTLGGSLSASGDDLVAAARRKLELWDVPASAIDKLERGGAALKSLTLYSPIAGVVVKKDVVDGMQLEAGAMPYEIVDLSSVWVLADVYESELEKVAVGMPARLTLKAFPRQTFEGVVAFIDPLLDPKTRTVKVRMSFPNPKRDLRPEMFGEVVLQSHARHALRIPADTILNSGTRTVVFVAIGDGKFQPREVKIGDTDGQVVEVVEGLAAGELVVTRANFLIDSESRLRASLASMGAGADQTPAAAAPADGAAAPPAAPSGHAGHGR
jgi:membrane fusion protein, copper/silver efflux system